MAITTRETTATGVTNKGSPLTNSEVDTNFVELQQNKIELNDLSVASEPDPSGDGSLAYDDSTGVFTYTPPADISGAVTFAAQAGEALSKGDVVYVSGVSGNTPVVSKADADDASKMPAFGIAEAAASLNAAVNVVTFGTLYDLDTSGFSAGDTVYVSTTAGTLTATKPTGESALIQNIGKVIRSHASAGSIKVGGAGRANDTPNLNDGNVFIGDSNNATEKRALTTADIASGTFADARIAQSNVTQHQAALSVTASQISDVTATAAELNTLDGVTSTASELNLVDGSSAGTIVNDKAVVYGSSGEVNATTLQIAGTSITSTAAELNILDGVTSTAAELNLLDGSTANTVVNSKAVVYGSGGEIAATSYTGDGSALTGISTASSLTATASGALSNGDLIIVNADGTVSAISQSTESSGSPAEWTSDTNFIGAAYDTANNKVIVAFKDGENDNKGYAVVGTISSSSISWGTKVKFHDYNTSQIHVAYDTNAGKALIVYKGTSSYGYCRVATVSGTSISFGTEVTYHSGSLNMEGMPAVVYHQEEQSLVIGYTRSGLAGAKVATISGTSVSIGSETYVNSGNTAWLAVSYDVAAEKILFVYADTANSQYSTARTGTVSGNSISFGSEAVLDNSGTSSYQAVTYDSTAQKHIIAYLVSSYPKYIVATVSGTSVSAGTAASYAEATYTSGPHVVQYDSAADKTLFAWRPAGRGGTTNDLTLRSATLSGTTLSFGTADIVGTGNDTPYVIVVDPDNTLNAVFYYDGDDGYAGDYVLFTHAGITNLTSGNYIGISDAAYSNGATATVQLVGSVDDAQSGLTAGQAYYVQADGSLSTTAGTPSVFAGTAVSATKLIVKG